MLIAIILFCVTYACLLIFSKHRAIVALCGAASFIITGILSPVEAVLSVDWNVLLMIAGTMGLVSLFIDSKMPMLLADLLLERVHTVRAATVILSVFAGLVSAFIDNVATVLMIAPVALVIAKRLKISPVPMLIAIAVSSNLQGAATLVGDTTSILLGGAAGMDFMDFFVYKGKVGIFWVVEVGAIVSAIILFILFRKDKDPITTTPRTKVTDFFPSVLLVAMIALLITASFIKEKPDITNGIICSALFLIGLIPQIFKKGFKYALQKFSSIDINTLLMLFGIFIVVGGIEKSGLLKAISGLFISIGSGNVFIIYTIIVWASVLFSAFIDNIPYVAAMLPVTAAIAQTLNIDPTLLYFGLLIGSTLGGNLTPVGASANIAAIGMLRKEGYTVTNKDFIRIGLPFTLSAVIAGYVLIWFIWAGC